MSPFHYLRYVLLASVILLARAQNTSNECSDMFCKAHMAGHTRDAENYLDRLCEQECEEELETSLRVAHLNYEHVRAAFGSSILIIVVIFAKLLWHAKLMERVASNIPESCMLIVLGTFFGGIITSLVRIDNSDSEPAFIFTPDLFFLVLLPPIVLDAGYFLDNRSFFENFFSISGTVWNAFAIGAMLYACSELEWMSSSLTLSAALLLGTICSAVDPVAVLAVFDEIHVNRQLHVLVFGESLLNDAVTVVLFRLFSVLANRQFISNNIDKLDLILEPSCHAREVYHLTPDDVAIDVSDGFLGFAQFLVVILSSMMIGYIFGALTAFTTKYSDHVHVLEPMIVFAMGYLAYVVAEMFELSGIITLITAAVVMRHYVEANLSRKSHTTLKYALKVVSIVSEMVIFLFLGLSLYNTNLLEWDTGLVLWTLLFAAVFRPIGVIVLTYLLNRIRVHKIGYKEQFVLSYSGLRGAVAFALALIWRTEEGLECFHNNIEEIKLRRRMLTAVTTLVMFTVFIQGTTIKPIVERMKVKKSSPTKPTMNEEIHTTAMDHILTGLEDIIGHFGHNRLRYKFQNFDVNYLRKLFERKAESRDEQIMQTFHRLQYMWHLSIGDYKCPFRSQINKCHRRKWSGSRDCFKSMPASSRPPYITKGDSIAAVEGNMVFDAKAGGKGTMQLFDVTTLSPSAEDVDVNNNEDEEAELPPLQDIINYSFYNPHRDHLKHQVHGEEEHRREHLHFRTVNLQPIKRHGVKHHVKHHKCNTQNIRSQSEKETPMPLPTLQTDDISIVSDKELSLFPPVPDDETSVNELSLFPPITDEDQVNSSIIFGTTMPDEIPIVSVHNDSLPKLESTIMETTV